ncbi:MAG: hypothetical protein FWC95_05435 [Defluviitaleaceae bacterium]|nr:hypothetical protein [Defluviitaleaceae bacterium]
MYRDYGKEIDGIYEQLEEITNLLRKPAKEKLITANAQDADSRMAEVTKDLLAKAAEKGGSGLVSYMGIFHTVSGNYKSSSSWVGERHTDDLLELIESKVATKVLTCIGNNDRLNLLLALLRAPRSAVQLVDECGYNTTGQVYHHLKPLLAADLVAVDENARGCYCVQPHRVQGLIMVLAGISDMLNVVDSEGAWEDSLAMNHIGDYN